MKKKNKSIVIILTIALVLLLALNYTGILSFSAIFSTIGITSLGCETPNFNSADPFYNNGTIQCTQSLGAKVGEFSLSPEEALGLFGVYTDNPVQEVAEVTKDECKYEFDASRKEYIYEYKVYGTSTTQSGGIVNCAGTGGSSGEWTFIGMTPIQCTPSDCHAYHIQSVSGCQKVYRRTVGEVYYLDPSVIYDYELNINMTMNDQTYSLTLDETETSGYNDLFRAELLEGTLKGTQSCPASPNVVAYIKNVFEPTPLEYRNKHLADTLVSNQIGAGDNIYSIMAIANAHNNVLNSFLTSDVSMGQYCEIATPESTSILTSYLACQPVGTVSVPVWNIYINANQVGIHVPSGNPEIVSAEVTKVHSAVRSEITVTVLNTGDSDNIQATVQCPWDGSPFASTEYIPEGEEREILINYQLAGVIGDCEVTAFSINSPQNRDSVIQKLFVYPFCPRDPPSLKHETVFTEKGCAFVCPKYESGESDTRYLSCKEFTSPNDYDRCASYREGGAEQITCSVYRANASLQYEPIRWNLDYEGCSEEEECTVPLPTPSEVGQEYICKWTETSASGCEYKNSYLGIHCTGIGKYMTTDRYMDSVFRGSINPFIPLKQDHKFFIVEINGKAICSFVNEYGYTDSGTPISELEFNYEIGFPEATEEGADEPTTPPTEPPTTPPTEEPEIPEVPVPPEETNIFDDIDAFFRGFGTMEWLAFIGVIIALIFGLTNLILSIGRKRGR